MAQQMLGTFRERYSTRDSIGGSSKWCVFKAIDATRDVVRAAVEEHLERRRVSKVDILQVCLPVLHFFGY